MNGEGASRSGRSWPRPHSSSHARRRVFGVFAAGPLPADAAYLTGEPHRNQTVFDHVRQTFEFLPSGDGFHARQKKIDRWGRGFGQ